ncbi:MAG: hypothetical protein WDW38_008106 [Sanguina aurantia]
MPCSGNGGGLPRAVTDALLESESRVLAHQDAVHVKLQELWRQIVSLLTAVADPVRLEGLASALTPLVSELEKLAKFGVSSEVAGQGILRRVSSQLPAWIDEASALTPAQAGNFTPMLAILSAHHETQYTRLFRS